MGKCKLKFVGVGIVALLLGVLLLVALSAGGVGGTATQVRDGAEGEERGNSSMPNVDVADEEDGGGLVCEPTLAMGDSDLMSRGAETIRPATVYANDPTVDSAADPTAECVLNEVLVSHDGSLTNDELLAQLRASGIAATSVEVVCGSREDGEVLVAVTYEGDQAP